MKEILDEESKQALIMYRIQRAYETLKEAECLDMVKIQNETAYKAAMERIEELLPEDEHYPI